MVLRRTLGEAGRLPQQLALRAFKKCQNADAGAPRRCRPNRSAGAEPGAVPRTEALWSGGRICRLSPRAPRISRGEALAGPPQPHSRVVRQILEEREGPEIKAGAQYAPLPIKSLSRGLRGGCLHLA